MSEHIEQEKPNFTEAITNFEKNNSNSSPITVSNASFKPLGGKTVALGQDYLYSLNEKYGNEFAPRLTECRKLIEITMRAWTGLPDDISMVWRTVVATLDGTIESNFFKPSMERDQVVDFLDFMALYYLLSASVATELGQTQDAIEYLFESAEARQLVGLLQSPQHQDFLSAFASRAAKERHAQDPKQADRHFVFECWKEWQKRPEIYKSKAAFARDMLDKSENLESQKVIEDWCRQWQKEHKE